MVSRPESPTNEVAEIRGRQRDAELVAMIGAFLGTMLLGMCLTVALGWPGEAALPTIVLAFLVAFVTTNLVGDFYNRRISRLWKEYNKASDRYWAERRQSPT